jgi:predicted O-methyltransferase YrrM
VYTTLQLAKKYLHYLYTAKNGKGHGAHSPFVFHFILDVLNNHQGFSAPHNIEKLRAALLKEKEILIIEDLGAGSRTSNTKKRNISQLVRSAVKPKKYSQLLYRLVKKHQPQTIVELGTSLGITTSYLASAAPSSKVITIEGSTVVQKVAKSNFEKLGLKNIESMVGNFDDVLPSALNHLPSVDLAYIDGNHRYKPTMEYFNQFLAKRNNETVMVFDDIHWSSEMEQAWEEIKEHPQVRCTIDIFFLGFVFFRDEFKEKQHFSIRF